MGKLTNTVTAEKLFQMSGDSVRRELVRGEVREMPPAGGEHGATTSRLHTEVALFVEDRGLGQVFAAETGFLIERDPDTVRAPDCAFIRAGRLPSGVPKKYVPVAPDLAVETISPHDSAPAVEEKVEGWLRAGVRLVWVIDPGKRTVTVQRPGARPRTLKTGDILEGEDVLPGFQLQVGQIWVGQPS